MVLLGEVPLNFRATLPSELHMLLPLVPAFCAKNIFSSAVVRQFSRRFCCRKAGSLCERISEEI